MVYAAVRSARWDASPNAMQDRFICTTGDLLRTLAAIATVAVPLITESYWP
jgi:hypothetical protein